MTALPALPWFDKEGVPTPTFRAFIVAKQNEARETKAPTNEQGELDLTAVRAKLVALQEVAAGTSEIKQKYERIGGTSDTFVVSHGFGTDRVFVSVFKGSGSSKRLVEIQVTSTTVTLVFNASFDATSAGLRVRMWAVG